MINGAYGGFGVVPANNGGGPPTASDFVSVTRTVDAGGDNPISSINSYALGAAVNASSVTTIVINNNTFTVDVDFTFTAGTGTYTLLTGNWPAGATVVFSFKSA